MYYVHCILKWVTILKISFKLFFQEILHMYNNAMIRVNPQTVLILTGGVDNWKRQYKITNENIFKTVKLT
jgi:hypothetical protein